MISLQTKNFIDDGYTRQAYIKPDEEGLHKELMVEYRPMTAEQAEDLDLVISKTDGSRLVRVMIEAVAKQLVSWSEVDEKGVMRPISSLTISRLPRSLILRMRLLVQGVWVGDPAPGLTGQEASEYAQGLLAAAQGKAPGPEQLEADRKN
jgi:hypothetical protein